MNKKKIFKPLIGTILSFAVIICVLMLVKGPNFVFAKYYYWNGISKQKSEDRKGAIKDYSRAIEYDEEFLTAYNNRGSAYLDLKEYKKAISDYNKAIELSPNYAQIYAYRGRAYFVTNKYKQAMADYDKALTLDKNLAYAYYQRGLLFYTVNYDFKKGCKDLNKAISLGFSGAEDLLKSGECE